MYFRYVDRFSFFRDHDVRISCRDGEWYVHWTDLAKFLTNDPADVHPLPARYRRSDDELEAEEFVPISDFARIVHDDLAIPALSLLNSAVPLVVDLDKWIRLNKRVVLELMVRVLRGLVTTASEYVNDEIERAWIESAHVIDWIIRTRAEDWNNLNVTFTHEFVSAGFPFSYVSREVEDMVFSRLMAMMYHNYRDDLRSGRAEPPKRWRMSRHVTRVYEPLDIHDTALWMRNDDGDMAKHRRTVLMQNMPDIFTLHRMHANLTPWFDDVSFSEPDLVSAVRVVATDIGRIWSSSIECCSPCQKRW